MPSRGSKLSLFLMELIMVIFFFSLSAAVCVRLFTSAHLLSENARNMTNAAMWSQNLGEVFTGKKGDVREISALYPDAFLTENDPENAKKGGSIVLFFDNDWEIVDDKLSDASYEAILEVDIKDAAEVYSDVSGYDIDYQGKAAVGSIAILDVRNLSENISSIADAGDFCILEEKVDLYLGKEN
ncbi:MAG: hypothetical protein K6E91_11260 [Butyrivibrio sp.]|nr:hypothetical protein [Butyrivibrio sp.]